MADDAVPAPAGTPTTWFDRNEKRVLGCLAAVTALATFFATILSLPFWHDHHNAPSQKKTTAAINFPHENSVETHTDFSGRVTNMPPDGVLWAFVQHTASGEFYPSYAPCVVHDGAWDCPDVRVGGGKGKDSNMIITLVDAKGSVDIMNYVIAVQYYQPPREPGLGSLPEHARPLATRRVTQLEG